MTAAEMESAVRAEIAAKIEEHFVKAIENGDVNVDGDMEAEWRAFLVKHGYDQHSWL